MDIKNYKAEELFAEIKAFSGNRIVNLQDVERLLEIVIKNDLVKQLDDVLFSAKAVTGLMRIIRNKDNKFEDEYFNKIKSEFAQNITIVISGLRNITISGSAFINEIFDEKYYQMTTESMQNLHSLCEDLDYVKMYFNDLRREK